MKKFLAVFTFLIPVFTYGLTLDEANLYGSRILVCKSEYVRYWTLMQKNDKSNASSFYQIYDKMNKKFYTLDECSLYKCSPAPDRMYKCMIPGK